MAELGCTIRNRRYVFRDLKDLMAKATPLRSGDVLAGVAPRKHRKSALPPRWCWPMCRFGDFWMNRSFRTKQDEVTRLIVDDHNAAAFARGGSDGRAISRMAARV